MTIYDTRNRPLKDLRLSVTDRCNFRCSYCMPHDEYEWTPKNEILSYEEMARLAKIFVSLGVERIRLTGGEPLVRQDLEELVHMLRAIDTVQDLSLTTNGALLTLERARRLKRAGLDRVNVSLDSLQPERFSTMTRRGDLSATLKGIEAAKSAGLDPVKINAVIVRGVNEDEIDDLFEFARREGLQLRFIEYMDVGHAHGWSLERTFTQREILQRLSAHGPFRKQGRVEGRAPARNFMPTSEGEDGSFGVIASVSDPFCASCSRARLTADGKLVSCLFAHDSTDLRKLLRSGTDDDQLKAVIEKTWLRRSDRYSEERLEAILSDRGYNPGDRNKLEMIRLGG